MHEIPPRAKGVNLTTREGITDAVEFCHSSDTPPEEKDALMKALLEVIRAAAITLALLNSPEHVAECNELGSHYPWEILENRAEDLRLTELQDVSFDEFRRGVYEELDRRGLRRDLDHIHDIRPEDITGDEDAVS